MDHEPNKASAISSTLLLSPFDASTFNALALRHHATISFDGAHHLLTDEHSANGTFLNGKRVRAAMDLTHGDVIGFGPDLRVRYERAPQDGSAGQDRRQRPVAASPTGGVSGFLRQRLGLAVGWSNNPQSVEHAAELVHQAVSLDATSPQAHLALGFVYVWQKHYGRAVAEAQQAIALNPNDAEGYAALGDILNYAGRPAEVQEVMEHAMRLDPHYPAEYLSNIGRAYFLLGRHKETIAILRRVVIRNPDYGPAHVRLTILYSELGRLAEAQAELAEVVRIYPRLSLEHYRRASYKDPAVMERYMNGLRKAGLK